MIILSFILNVIISVAICYSGGNICAHMWRRWLRITAHKCWCLQATSLSLKIKLLYLFLGTRYLNRGSNDSILDCQRMMHG
jgi:hypothetical protein